MWTSRIARGGAIAGLVTFGVGAAAQEGWRESGPPRDAEVRRMEDHLQRLRAEQERVLRDLRAMRDRMAERSRDRDAARPAPPRVGPGAWRGPMGRPDLSGPRCGPCPQRGSCPQAAPPSRGGGSGWRGHDWGRQPGWGGRAWGGPGRGFGRRDDGRFGGPRWGMHQYGPPAWGRGPMGPGGWRDRFHQAPPEMRERLGRHLKEAGERLMRPPERPGSSAEAGPGAKAAEVDRLLHELRDALRELRASKAPGGEERNEGRERVLERMKARRDAERRDRPRE